MIACVFTVHSVNLNYFCCLRGNKNPLMWSLLPPCLGLMNRFMCDLDLQHTNLWKHANRTPIKPCICKLTVDIPFGGQLLSIQNLEVVLCDVSIRRMTQNWPLHWSVSCLFIYKVLFQLLRYITVTVVVLIHTLLQLIWLILQREETERKTKMIISNNNNSNTNFLYFYSRKKKNLADFYMIFKTFIILQKISIKKNS